MQQPEQLLRRTERVKFCFWSHNAIWFADLLLFRSVDCCIFIAHWTCCNFVTISYNPKLWWLEDFRGIILQAPSLNSPCHQVALLRSIDWAWLFDNRGVMGVIKVSLTSWTVLVGFTHSECDLSFSCIVFSWGADLCTPLQPSRFQRGTGKVLHPIQSPNLATWKIF